MTMLEIRDLLVFYENALAINNLTLELQNGELVGLLGSNGAGKSTLMYTLSGVMLDQKIREERRGGPRITILGQVVYEGEDITNLKAAERVERGIVLCPERRRVFVESTVLENLKIGAHRTARSEHSKLLKRIWELFPALYDLRTRTAGFLSGGEQQMLAIGRALMARPRLFLIDEPLMGLSPDLQITVVDAIRAICDGGATVLVSEQHARPILPILKRGYIIESGSITVSGTGAELVENPHVRAAYLGS